MRNSLQALSERLQLRGGCIDGFEGLRVGDYESSPHWVPSWGAAVLRSYDGDDRIGPGKATQSCWPIAKGAAELAHSKAPASEGGRYKGKMRRGESP